MITTFSLLSPVFVGSTISKDMVADRQIYLCWLDRQKTRQDPTSTFIDVAIARVCSLLMVGGPDKNPTNTDNFESLNKGGIYSIPTRTRQGLGSLGRVASVSRARVDSSISKPSDRVVRQASRLLVSDGEKPSSTHSFSTEYIVNSCKRSCKCYINLVKALLSLGLTHVYDKYTPFLPHKKEPATYLCGAKKVFDAYEHLFAMGGVGVPGGRRSAARALLGLFGPCVLGTTREKIKKLHIRIFQPTNLITTIGEIKHGN